MNISELQSEDAILAEIGTRIAQRRLDFQLTQAEVAEQAGVGKRTLERIESGSSAQLSSIIRIFRVLDLLPNLDQMIPEAEPSPMDLLLRKGKARKRVSLKGRSKQSDKPWSWDDES